MIERDNKTNTWSLTWIVLQLAVVFSVFSQIESIERFARPGMYIMWIAVLALGCYKNHGKLHMDAFSQRFLIAYALFCLYCLFIGLIDSRHFSAHYIRVLIVPLLVTIAGSMYIDGDNKLVNRLGRVYLICSVLFGLWVQRTYFPSYTSWLSARIYLFQQKNSAGQIWVAAIFVSILLLDYKNNIEKSVIYIACGYLLIMTGISQCRTALLGVAVAIVAFSISRAKHKGRWIIIVVALATAAWLIPFTRQFIEQALVLNKYAGTDLNTFSSGRIGRYEKAFLNIFSSPIIGVGEYYVDCSYILILAESGLLGLIIVEWVWLKKITMCFGYSGEPKAKTFLFMMTVFYIIESILEGYPPFGPGVSSFMFWFLSSQLINQSYREMKIENEA